ncbi:sarcosine oxidase subunit gamma [Notoacmeibacter ruber]|uniref:Sarcosine oxidase subunit gamma n=1 Tax=Notoacmeibacter ruber TaxID=2670375 RepID=A0A3L7JFD2_9HYPH|nr:sarcosine oxidase subunit gamma family protein [Notoacmeibacter ruber]RLQ89396.1 sarcosine oxidase subunit gamma [Notoacmeibacter ruber]
MSLDTQNEMKTVQGSTRVETLPPQARFSLRARAESIDELGRALGVELPQKIGRRESVGERDVLCLGPDEWLVTAPESEAGNIGSALAAIYETTPHSLSNISDRELSVMLDGPDALTLLSMGCPRDLERLPVGAAVRTIFDNASVILWRDGEQRFRMDIWRSFAPHAVELLHIGQAELRAGL